MSVPFGRALTRGKNRRNMEKIILKNSDLEVTRLCFGGCPMGGYGWGEVQKSDLIAAVHDAIQADVNFFDTAYLYLGSEVALGKALAGGYRERIKLATKLPPFMVRNNRDFERIFTEQLKRLQTDRVDYYFIHMLSDVNVWNRLLELGIEQWLEEKQKQGRIINLGFSYHGGVGEFKRLIDVYPWHFCMIQYNYLDEHNQAGISGLTYASSKGLPVFVMEPLRGGKLVTSLPKAVCDIWESASVKRSPAEWALRFVWNHPEVTLALSGMNTMDMLCENIAVANTAQANSLSVQELELFVHVREILQQTIAIPCTGCNYCMPCPSGVDIPVCFSCYNDRGIESKLSAKKNYLMQTTMKTQRLNASLCIKCGLCEQHCPQNIAIREELIKVARALEGVLYSPLSFLVKKFMQL